MQLEPPATGEPMTMNLHPFADPASPAAAWPTRRVLWIATLAAMVPSLLLAVMIFAPLADGLDRYGYVPGRDFVNFWLGGRLALEGRVAAIYDLDAYHAVLKAMFAPAERFMNFSYPPHALALLLPLALLPYSIALPVWLLAGLTAFVAAAGGLVAAQDRRPRIVLLALSPIALLMLAIAQATGFLALLFVAGLALSKRRPVVAGVLLGLLTIKPQLGLLIPVYLVLRGAWTTVATAAVTAIALAGLSVVLFGIEPWRAYVEVTLPYQARVIAEPYGFVWTLMISPYAWLCQLGVAAPLAMKLHVAAALAVAALVGLAVRRCNDDRLAIAITALGAVLVTPYSLTYDLTLPAAALFAWLAQAERPPERWQSAAIGLFWASPFVLMWLNVSGIPLGPPILAGLFAALLVEARQQHGTRINAVREGLRNPTIGATFAS